MLSVVRGATWFGRSPVDTARLYFAVQAIAGAMWWVAVFAIDDVRVWTLGTWNPRVVVVADVAFFVIGSAWAAITGNRHVALVVAVWTAVVALGLGVHGLLERMAGWGVVAMVIAAIGTGAAASTLWTGRLPRELLFVGPFAFHVADEATRAHHVRRSLIQLVVFWTTFFVFVPLLLVAVERRLRLTWPLLQSDTWAMAGALMFLVGSLIGLWSCFTMALAGDGTPLPAETARNLVVRGPYRLVRNPMAVAGVIQTVGVGLWCGSWMVVTAAVAGAAIWNVVIRPAEEADLERRFGDPYRNYRQRVRCWVPSVRAFGTHADVDDVGWSG